MTEKTVHTCPLCRRASLVTHCNGRCGWFICRNKLCDAMLDPTRRRGHRLAPDVTVPIRQRVRLIGSTWQVAS